MSFDLDFKKQTKATERATTEYVRNITGAYNDALKDVKGRMEEMFTKYSIDGKLPMEAMQKMTIKDQKKYTRLRLLYRNIDSDLAALNRGAEQQLRGHLTKAYSLNYADAGAEINKRLGAGVAPFEVLDRQAIYNSTLSEMGRIGLLDNRAATQRGIQRAITQGIVQGDSIKTMSDRVTKALGTNANNAVRIARTETNRVMGEARNDMMGEAAEKGVEIIERWSAAIDENTRDSHADMDGEEKKHGELFSNGLEYPGDSRGDASEVINCRCALTARVVNDNYIKELSKKGLLEPVDNNGKIKENGTNPSTNKQTTKFRR